MHMSVAVSTAPRVPRDMQVAELAIQPSEPRWGALAVITAILHRTACDLPGIEPVGLGSVLPMLDLTSPVSTMARRHAAVRGPLAWRPW